jgi:cell shape-determining protein MreC
MNMNYIELITILFGASGFWKMVELIITSRNNRKKSYAELKNLQADAESQIVQNWIQWTQTLEKRIKELEGVEKENRELQREIQQQFIRLGALERKVEELARENKELRKELEDLSKNTDHG